MITSLSLINLYYVLYISYIIYNLYIFVYIYIYIYTNLLVNAIVRLPYPWSGDLLGPGNVFSTLC